MFQVVQVSARETMQVILASNCLGPQADQVSVALEMQAVQVSEGVRVVRVPSYKRSR